VPSDAIATGALTASRSAATTVNGCGSPSHSICCDREAVSFFAATRGISGEDVRKLMAAAVEHRFGRVNRLPVTIEWLSDNGSCYIAGDTRSFARDIGVEPRTTPIESRRAMEWLKPWSAPSSATMCASIRVLMQAQ
jgi:hypothetical protein